MTDPYSQGYGLRLPDSRLISKFMTLIREKRIKKSKLIVLDIGCGLGGNSYLTDLFEDLLYYGIDISSHAILRATEFSKTRYRNCNIKFIESDTKRFLQKTNMQFDVFLDRASFQHHSSIAKQEDLQELCKLMREKSVDSGAYLLSLWASEYNKNSNQRFETFFPFERALPQLVDNFEVIQIESQTTNIFAEDFSESLSSKEFMFLGKVKRKEP
jgi:SAM-dependent methyltransferase